MKQPAAKLFRLNKRRDKFPNADKIDQKGFFIGLTTSHLSKKKINYLVNNLLKLVKSKFKKIVGVTGSTGFLGSALCKGIKKQNKFELVKFRGNILNKNHLKKWFRENNIEYLIHLAAVVPTYKFVNNKDYAKKVNFVGTKNIVYELNKSKYIRWFFYSSSSHVYKFNNFKLKESSLKKPFSTYGKTKLKAEYYLKEKVSKNIRLCCGRIFSLEGKKQKVIFYRV